MPILAAFLGCLLRENALLAKVLYTFERGQLSQLRCGSIWQVSCLYICNVQVIAFPYYTDLLGMLEGATDQVVQL